MKSVILFGLIFLTAGFSIEQKKKSIIGMWNINSWINLETKSDFIKEYEMDYKVLFTSDSVYISEKDSIQVKDYKFSYYLKNDSVFVKNLGVFRINHLDENELKLNITTAYIFTEDKELFDEELTLIRTQN